MNLSTLGPWRDFLSNLLSKPETASLFEKVDSAYGSAAVYPPREDLFTAFSLTPPESVRVVILGQDPYHGAGQAHGLAFSVRPGVKLPPSLVNIYKEREADLGIPSSPDGCLTHWAEQGVFLLNTVLTVEADHANSHKDYGWQSFTDGVIESLAQLPQPIAFLLWGAQAQKKAKAIQNSPYPRLLIQSPHPSPLSSYRGFFGSRPFSQVNEFLTAQNEAPIQW